MVVCERDRDCDDGRFCNGVERCRPGEGDPAGCVPGETPCDGDCDEDEDDCILECPNEDGDGHPASPCGGDCDDNDPNRFPGNPEVCDTAGHDEDCDPDTFGYRDQDGDGDPDAACCNGAVCGTDCNDLNPAIHSRAAELCDGLDNDCNGVVDDRTPSCACAGGEPARPCGTMRDGALVDEGSCVIGTETCVDGTWVCTGAVFATAERCDGAEDEDCDGAVDEETTIACYVDGDTDGHGAGSTLVDVCPTSTGACPVEYSATNDDCNDAASSVSPSAAEACNGDDDDCDDTIDEDFECPANGIVAGTNICGRTGGRRCANDCTFLDADYYLASESAATCDYCADTASGVSAERPSTVTTSFVFNSDALAAGTATLHGSAQNGFGSAVLTADFNQVGALYFAPFEMGHGTVELELTVLAATSNDENPAQGWAAVVFEDGPGALVGTSSSNGVPTGREGFSVRWRVDNGIFDGDRISVFRQEAAGQSQLSSRLGISSPPGLEAGVDEIQYQTVHLTLRPDNTDTPTNETSLRVEFPDIPDYDYECTGSGCGLTIRTGTVYRFGVTAGTTSSLRAGFIVLQNDATITRNEICP